MAARTWLTPPSTPGLDCRSWRRQTPETDRPLAIQGRCPEATAFRRCRDLIRSDALAADIDDSRVRRQVTGTRSAQMNAAHKPQRQSWSRARASCRPPYGHASTRVDGDVSLTSHMAMVPLSCSCPCPRTGGLHRVFNVVSRLAAFSSLPAAGIRRKIGHAACRRHHCSLSHVAEVRRLRTKLLVRGRIATVAAGGLRAECAALLLGLQNPNRPGRVVLAGLNVLVVVEAQGH